jgi:hypothetical protein
MSLVDSLGRPLMTTPRDREARVYKRLKSTGQLTVSLEWIFWEEADELHPMLVLRRVLSMPPRAWCLPQRQAWRAVHSNGHVNDAFLGRILTDAASGLGFSPDADRFAIRDMATAIADYLEDLIRMPTSIPADVEASHLAPLEGIEVRASLDGTTLREGVV